MIDDWLSMSRFQFLRMQYKTVSRTRSISHSYFSLFYENSLEIRKKILIKKFWLFTEYEWIWIQSLYQGIVRD